jgi:16S rRNA C967 or C1407 C5-methylase (RsmB/RsmF family)
MKREKSTSPNVASPKRVKLTKTIPDSFLKFLESNGVDPSFMDSLPNPDELPRFVRVNPRKPITSEQLSKEINDLEENSQVQVKETILKDFYQILPGTVKIAGLSSYETGSIYGIDLSSGFAVEALGVEPGMHTLDLCCAPGAKLCMIADKMELKGKLVAVDVNFHRVNTCRNILTKYGILRASSSSSSKKEVKEDEFVTLIEADGSSTSCVEKLGTDRFDRVLVDAECTHDGSLKHLLKFQTSWGWETFEQRVMDPTRITTLQNLQRNLARNGFKMLKPGGEMVYSTCSFCTSQNEDIVSWLLAQEPSASIVPLSDMLKKFSATEGSIKGTVRFIPSVSKTSGLFVAKIRKK